MLLKRKFIILGVTLIISLYLYEKLKVIFAGTSPVPGWSKTASRNFSDYVNETLEPFILPKPFCAENKSIIIIICSRIDGFNQRAAIRDTWAQKHANISFYFLLGQTVNANLHNEILTESLRFGDIIQERFVDSYNNATLKTVTMLKLFIKYCAKSYRYLMKADDDLFVNIPLLSSSLNSVKRHALLMGKIRHGATPFRSSLSKWYMPFDWYSKNVYPDFLCGAGYIMSRDVAKKLYRCAFQTPLIHTEDVYVTGICAESIGLKLTNNKLFSCNSKRSICEDRNFITSHYYTSEKMHSLKKILQHDDCFEFEMFNILKRIIFFIGFP